MEIAEFYLSDRGAMIEKAWNGQEALDKFDILRSKYLRYNAHGYYDAGNGWLRNLSKDSYFQPSRREKYSDYCNDSSGFTGMYGQMSACWNEWPSDKTSHIREIDKNNNGVYYLIH